MATFKIKLDKRRKLNSGKYNLCIRVTVGDKVQYLKITKLSEAQYEHVFFKKSIDTKSIEFRESCNQKVTKAEKIFASMRYYNPTRFKKLYFEEDVASYNTDSTLPKTFELKELVQNYLDNVDNIKLNTRKHCKKAMNLFEKQYSGLDLYDITPNFLKKFEQNQLKAGLSPNTIASYLRVLKRIINYFREDKKYIPIDYEYPFRKGGYSIRTVNKKKLVNSAEEIKTIIEFNDFESVKQEYARDIWLTLYYCNGINFIDLLRMRWDNIDGNYIKIIRKKTETTKKINFQEITIPLIDDLRELLAKIGDPTSQFIIGQIKPDYSETTLLNRRNKLRQQINPELRKISSKLNLSVPVIMQSARDCYASTLRRNNVSRDKIGEQLGHSDSNMTKHYLDSLSIEETFEINKHLVIREPKLNNDVKRSKKQVS